MCQCFRIVVGGWVSTVERGVVSKDQEERIIIFTDGASKGNPGPGGWGTIVDDGETVTELGGRSPSTTNNRMEMEAAVRGLEQIQSANRPALLYTDSTYLIQGITKWISAWRRRGWTTASGGDVLNRDLWERLDALNRGVGNTVHWRYVPGHAGVPGNERVDAIASESALGNHVDLYRGPSAAYAIDLTPPTQVGKVRSATRHRRKGAAAGTPPRRSSGKAYSYLSLVDGVANRHESWDECKKRVHGVSGARFKKALSADDEAEILAKWGVHL